MVELFVNSREPDQTPRSAASDLVLQGLPVTRLRAPNLQWVKCDFCTNEAEGPTHMSHICNLDPHKNYE